MLNNSLIESKGIIDCKIKSFDRLSMNNLVVEMHTILLTLDKIRTCELYDRDEVLERIKEANYFIASSIPEEDAAKWRLKNFQVCLSAFAERGEKFPRFASVQTEGDLINLMFDYRDKAMVIRVRFETYKADAISDDQIAELKDFFSVISEYVSRNYQNQTGCFG